MNNNGESIEKNPSVKKLKDELTGMSILLDVGKKIGIKLDDDIPDIEDMKKQLDCLAKLPDEFNSYFADKGWIAYESFHVDTMQKAVALMRQGKPDAAENELNHYRLKPVGSGCC